MKLAVIYDSKTNNTAAVAGYMAEAMIHMGPVEVSPKKEDFKELFEIFGKRFATQALKING